MLLGFSTFSTHSTYTVLILSFTFKVSTFSSNDLKVGVFLEETW